METRKFFVFLPAILLYLAGTSAWSQNRTIQGLVTASEDGSPLIGVNIVVPNTPSGTITDVDGRYSLEIPADAATLNFSYVGYRPQTIEINRYVVDNNNRSVIDVVMELDAQLVDEVVVIGYGVQKKSDLTGAVSQLEAKDIAKLPTSSVEQALQGKIAGVQVTPISGEPGRGGVIRIRGVGTLNNADPLYVVDGMILNSSRDIAFINNQDIESISVLKDASATAIYGARGANGVVIITTKKGSKDRDGQVSVSSYYGTQQVIRQIDVANGAQYAMLANELSVNEGRPAPHADPESFGEGTNWQDVIFRDAPIQNHQISFSGGSDKGNYLVSGNYFKQSGIIRGSEFERYSLRSNNEYKVKPYLRIGNNLALIYSNRDNAADVLMTSLRTAPITAPYDDTGKFSDASRFSSTGNAEASIFYNYSKGKEMRAIGNLFGELTFLKHFTLKSSFGLNYSLGEGKSFTPIYFVSPIQQSIQNRLNTSTSRQRSWLWENTLTYSRDWGKQHIDLLGGITSQDNFGESLGGSRANFLSESEDLFFLSAGEQGTESVFNGVFEDWGILSYLFRANYTLLDRYLVTVSGRVDGSSRFGPNKRYGVFPSVAVGWNVTNEPFMEGIDAISRLKFRAGWGQTGNDRIGDYAYIPLVENNLSAVFGKTETLNNGATSLGLANPDLQWEAGEQANIGVEIGFFDNRLQAELDWYNRTTRKILFRPDIPKYIGADPPVVNVASVRNRGIDLKIDWREELPSVKGSYNFGIVASTVDNEVLQLNNRGNPDFFSGGLGLGGQLGTNSRKGLEAGSFWGYQVDGIFQNQEELALFPKLGNQVPGDLRFVDLNGDGIISPLDRTVIGSPTPNLIYGFFANVEIHGFDLSIDFNGQSGNQIINSKRMSRFGLYNFEAVYLDRWHGEGTSNTEPRVTTSGVNYEFSERFVEDGSFLRLRNVQVGYTLPKIILERLHVQTLRVYATGANLLTWQKYSGYTPEIFNSSVFDAGIDRGVYPLAKSLTVGLDLTF